MRIIILGYGRMGQAVEEQALDRGHEIVDRIDREDISRLGELNAGAAEAIIDFTLPEAFQKNLPVLLKTGIPVVTGTTGWYDNLERVRQEVEASGSAFLYAPNFSVGVQILFQLNQRLAELMNGQDQYDAFIEERHHRRKADAPSGTAIQLARDLMDRVERKSSISNAELRTRPIKPEELSVAYTRSGQITGYHEVTWTSEIDRVSISHEAYNRRGFALGAVIAAEWLQGKRGFFEFKQLFG